MLLKTALLRLKHRSFHSVVITIVMQQKKEKAIDSFCDFFPVKQSEVPSIPLQPVFPHNEPHPSSAALIILHDNNAHPLVHFPSFYGTSFSFLTPSLSLGLKSLTSTLDSLNPSFFSLTHNIRRQYPKATPHF